MTEKDFMPLYNDVSIPLKGSVAYRSPSNIALVKYWGKREPQLPSNPSLSFTLQHCATTTQVHFDKRTSFEEKYALDLFFEGKPKEAFKPKIVSFFERIELYMPFIRDLHFVVETSNSFPHSSGIASSASGMSALALCLMDIERLFVPNMDSLYFNRKASFLARLGSGSASRSVEGELVVWGKHDLVAQSSDLYGVKYPGKVHPVFANYQDTILLVDKGEKQVSSTVGHQLMHGHPFATQRFDQAGNNLTRLTTVLAEGDLKGFIELVESEALSLHAMMMTSLPYFMLMKPNTLKILEKIWQFRQGTGLPVCFTLDAGANVHVLYPEKDKQKVFEFIKNELVAYCQNGQYICDRTGKGAERLFDQKV
ncbi:diphosphomevalonate decarboxylase [Ascidiimonas aurantiaca]|uniref:diphosphomevalonate/mevalonate 3,5-bisphosphate decarboxylase family protein n=1 Tax=Ascidiimonas aurantiaca TaxID=1685432 RepID=UPI0030EB71C9